MTIASQEKSGGNLKNIHLFSVSFVLADGLAPPGARPSAGTMLTMKPISLTFTALEGLNSNNEPYAMSYPISIH